MRSYHFLYKHNILYSNEFDLRTSHSNDKTVIKFVDNLTQSINIGNYIVDVFLNLSKEFDAAHHNIPLCNLSKEFDAAHHDIPLCNFSHYGVRGIKLNWFDEYLSNRK